jgi:hypothetical protein
MRQPPPRTTKRRTFRRRNYRAEYQRRVAKALTAGKSRSAGRGHPRAADLPKTEAPIDRASRLEKALDRMKRGASQNAAAVAEGVSTEKLRLYRLQNTTSQRQGRTWAIFDLRPQAYRLASGGKVKIVTVARNEGTEVSAYWHAVNNFLRWNDRKYLGPFIGKGVRDVANRFHQFETGPNVLRKMEAVGDLNFIDIYANTTGEA